MAHVVNVTGLYGYRSLVEELGGDADQLVRKVDLDPGVFDRDEQSIAFDTLAALLEMTALQLQQTGFGLMLSLRQSSRILGACGPASRNPLNRRSAVEYMLGVFHQHAHIAPIQLTSEGPLTLIHCAVPDRAAAFPQATEFGLGVAVGCLRALFGANWSPEEVWFRHRAGMHRELYRMIFRAPTRFGQARDALTVKADLPEKPAARYDSRLDSAPQRHVDDVAAAGSDDFLTRVKQVIARQLGSGGASLSQVSAALGVRPRTLQHRLSQANTAFISMADEVRAEAAKKYLAQSNSGLAQLATRLGYADQAVFSRAFRRWSGMTPSQWRRENRPRGRNQ